MLFRKICGVDLGTDTIKICDKNEKKYVHEKNMIAVRDKAHVIAIGLKAFEMYEKAPVSVEAGSPMKNVGIADVRNMGIVLNRLLKRYTNPVTNYPEVSAQSAWRLLRMDWQMRRGSGCRCFILWET